MTLTPRLPKGYHAQPAFHHQEGTVGYDFFRAYNAARELDPMRSYWLMTYDSDARGPMPPKTRWLGFVDWVIAEHRSANDYHVFANPQTKIAEIRRWVEATESGDLVDVKEI
jgi:hypothetical protein